MTSLKCWNSGVESKVRFLHKSPEADLRLPRPCLFAGFFMGASFLGLPSCRSVQHTSSGVQQFAS